MPKELEVRLKEAFDRLRLMGFKYFERHCDCGWCQVNRSSIKLDDLQYFLDHAISLEEYGTCSRIKKEIKHRESNPLTEEKRKELIQWKKDYMSGKIKNELKNGNK